MNIQNLIKSGYSLIDIQELLILFRKNLSSFNCRIIAKAFNLSDLHTLKGGLIMLEFRQLSEQIAKIEENAKATSIEPYLDEIAMLIVRSEDCANKMATQLANQLSAR